MDVPPSLHRGCVTAEAEFYCVTDFVEALMQEDREREEKEQLAAVQNGLSTVSTCGCIVFRCLPLHQIEVVVYMSGMLIFNIGTIYWYSKMCVCVFGSVVCLCTDQQFKSHTAINRVFGRAWTPGQNHASLHVLILCSCDGLPRAMHQAL